MLPKTHFILGLIFVVVLYFFFSPIISFSSLIIIFLSSILIDIDHYIYHIVKNKNWNLFQGYKWYIKNIKRVRGMTKEQRKKTYIGFYFLHGIEILIALFLLGEYLSPVFTYILIGFVFHLVMDSISEIILEQRQDKISLIFNLLTFKKLTNIENLND